MAEPKIVTGRGLGTLSADLFMGTPDVEIHEEGNIGTAQRLLLMYEFRGRWQVSGGSRESPPDGRWYFENDADAAHWVATGEVPK